MSSVTQNEAARRERIESFRTGFEALCEDIFSLLRDGEFLRLSLSAESSQFIRFNRSLVRQTGHVDDGTLYIDFIYRDRQMQSHVSFSGVWERDLAMVSEEMRVIRENILDLPEDPFIVPPGEASESSEVHEGELLDDERAAEVLCAAMRGADLAGIYASGPVVRAHHSSAGHRHWFSTESFALEYSLITSGERMLKDCHAGRFWDTAEYENRLARARERLAKLESPAKTLSPGEYRAYFAPHAVSDILDLLSHGAFSEGAYRQGPSPLGHAKKGTSLSPLLNIAEDFTDGLVPRFNTYGELSPAHLRLVSEGKLESFLVSSRTALEYGLRSNFAQDGEALRAPCLAGGDLEEADILERLGTGVYISNLHYLNWSDRVGGRITGITRFACFWVEQGKIVSPIENMRFDDTLYSFFGENLEALTRQVEVFPDVSTYFKRQVGGIQAPGMLVKAFRLTL